MFSPDALDSWAPPERLTFSVVHWLRYFGKPLPMFPSSGKIWTTSSPLFLAKQISSYKLVFNCLHNQLSTLLPLLPRAQASSLPRKPPPTIVMDMTWRETDSSRWKSSMLRNRVTCSSTFSGALLSDGKDLGLLSKQLQKLVIKLEIYQTNQQINESKLSDTI